MPKESSSAVPQPSPKKVKGKLRRMTPQGLSKLGSLEGFRSSVYLDEGGRETVGYGHLVTNADRLDGKFQSPITQAEGLALLQQDVSQFEDGVSSYLPDDLPLEYFEFDALVSFAFNVGLSAFGNSTLLKYVLRKDRARVSEEFLRWVYVTNAMTGRKTTSSGLLFRRQAEVAMWNGTY